MKKTLRFSIAALLVVLAVGIMSFTAGKNAAAKETSPKEHKKTAEKKDKKFVSVTYFFLGGSVSNPSRWSTSGTPCDAGTAVICSITFDTETYPLEDGKPSTDFLEDEIAVHQNDSPTLTSFTVNGVTYIRRS